MKVGDVVTVKISIKDKASLDNTWSGRATARPAQPRHQMGHEPAAAQGQAGRQHGGLRHRPEKPTKGEGAITRSESIELLVAAVVTGVMPNGNLVISGTQEVRVNFEVRVLTVQGIVRPRESPPRTACPMTRLPRPASPTAGAAS
jgi:flagellar L-ring protein precursor FlgH